MKSKSDIKELKARRVIPKDTPYCYTPLEKHPDGWGYKIKVCPFFKSLPDSNLYGWCKFINCEIEDMCKSCGINWN